MVTRTHRTTSSFARPFVLKGVDRALPPGDYQVVTEEELIEGLSFPVYRRVSTAILVPGQAPYASSVEMVTIDPRDLEAARGRDTMSQTAAIETDLSGAPPRPGHPRLAAERS